MIPSVTVLQIVVRKCQQLYSNCRIVGHVVQLFSPSIFVADIPLLSSNKLFTRESRLFCINAFVTRNKENATLWKALLAVTVFWISLLSYHANNRSCHTCWLLSLFYLPASFCREIARVRYLNTLFLFVRTSTLLAIWVLLGKGDFLYVAIICNSYALFCFWIFFCTIYNRRWEKSRERRIGMLVTMNLIRKQSNSLHRIPVYLFI